MTVSSVKIIKPDSGKVLVSPDGKTYCVSVMLKEGEDETGWSEVESPEDGNQ